MNAIEYGVASFVFEGQNDSGDLHVVHCANDRILLAVIDGIGHGDTAATAASIASSTLQSHPLDSLENLVQLCHEALRSTRGVVMSLAAIFPKFNRMLWLGVGNVQGLLQRADAPKGTVQETLLLRGGVIGAQLPILQSTSVSLRPGDTIFFATDGVRGDFLAGVSPFEAPQRCADRILRDYCRGNDDALALVVRYLGDKL